MLATFVALSLTTARAAKAVTVTSPSGRLSVELQTGEGGLRWTVNRDGKPVCTASDISMQLASRVLGGEATPKSVKQTQMKETIRPVVPLKFSVIESQYNQATLNFGQYRLELRVMDNAVAYRFVTDLKGEVEVMDEQFNIMPTDGFTAHYQTCGSFSSSRLARRASPRLSPRLPSRGNLVATVAKRLPKKPITSPRRKGAERSRGASSS